MRVAGDVDVGEQSPLSDRTEQFVGELFGSDLLRRLLRVDGDDGRGSGHLVDLPHAQRTHADRNDCDQRHPGPRQDGPAL